MAELRRSAATYDVVAPEKLVPKLRSSAENQQRRRSRNRRKAEEERDGPLEFDLRRNPGRDDDQNHLQSRERDVEQQGLEL